VAGRNLNISRGVFYLTLALSVVIIIFGLGLYSGVKNNKIAQFARQIKSNVTLVLSESPNLLHTHPKDFLQPSRQEGSGVTINEKNNNDLILLTGFFDNSNSMRLIHRNGDLVNQWKFKFSDLFPDTSHMKKPPVTDWNIDLHGSLILPDGSVVFNFEYGGLMKISRCGELIWKIARPTHHSIDMAEDGSFWVPGRKIYNKGDKSPFPPFATPFVEDTILHVSPTGKIISELSVPKIFYDNGFESLLTSTGMDIIRDDHSDQELVHLNQISVLSSQLAKDFPLFEEGDLLLSLRNYNMLLVVDPDDEKIKWWKIGPWKRQHSPEFVAGGKITVFNNNTYKSSYRTGEDISHPDIPRVSNIIEVDPVTNKTLVLYGESPGQEFLSIIRGKQESVQGGDILVTEFEGGRVFEIDSTGKIIWEYINHYDKGEVAEMTSAHVYSKDYLEVNDWSCNSSS
jgi:hypothetical protein